MADSDDFDGAVELFRQALAAFVKGDPVPALALFSQRDDVTLANPLGPPRLGWAKVKKAVEEAAAHLQGGSSIRFEEVSRYTTADLGYIVQLERTEAQVDGEEMAPISLRVTMIFRREGDTWKVAHRHADPITTPREASSIVERASQ